jgi:hypothetical protein
MEQLLGREQPRRQAFRVVAPQETFQHMAIGRQPIGPEIFPHQGARGAKLRFDERPRHLGCGGVTKAGKRHRLRVLERLEDGGRKPGIAF